MTDDNSAEPGEPSWSDNNAADDNSADISAEDLGLDSQERTSSPEGLETHMPQIDEKQSYPRQQLYPYPPFYAPSYLPSSSVGFIDPSFAIQDSAQDHQRTKNKGGVTEPFPEKLHRMLAACEMDGLSDVASFFPHGRAFAIHKPRRFVSEIMPRFFRQSKLTSFQRQLNLYGFRRISQGRDNGGYYHPMFIKGHSSLCVNMKRIKIKGDKKMQRETENEPNFYAYPPIEQVFPSTPRALAPMPGGYLPTVSYGYLPPPPGHQANPPYAYPSAYPYGHCSGSAPGNYPYPAYLPPPPYHQPLTVPQHSPMAISLPTRSVDSLMDNATNDAVSGMPIPPNEEV